MHSLLIIFAVLAIFVSCGNSQTVANCGEHATYFTCGPNCDTECATLNEPCYVRYIRCPDGCYCDDGHARRAVDSVCIPISDCNI